MFNTNKKLGYNIALELKCPSRHIGKFYDVLARSERAEVEVLA